MRPYKVVLAPFPLTSLSLLGYWALKEAGLVSDSTFIRYHWRPQSAYINEPLESDEIFWLLGSDYEGRLASILGQLSPATRNCCSRIMEYCLEHRLNTWENFRKFYEPTWPDPRLGLEWGARCLAWCLQNQTTPETYNDPCPIPTAVNLSLPRPLVQSVDVQPVPTFASRDPTELRIVHYAQEAFQEGNAWQLVGRHLTVLVVGPPSSGKSTVVATLGVLLNCLVESLRSRADWHDLDLKIQTVNADLGTPTVPAIQQGHGLDRGRLQGQKREWTPALAYEAFSHILAHRASANILVVDCPGKLVPFQDIITCAGDSAILLTHDWNLRNEWARFLARLGLEIVAQARTHKTSADLGSTVRIFDRGEFVTGRITGLQRVVWAWDPFLQFLARALLYDLLPGTISRRFRKKGFVLNVA